METYDYVIVGAGSAGSVLANRLSEDGTATVLVLEAGPSDWHPFIHIPAGFIKTFHDARVNWLYSMEPTEWTGGRRILAPRGKTLGGSSSINGHIYNRGQRMDLRYLGAARQSRLGLRRRAPLFPAHGAAPGRRRPDLPRPRRRPDRLRSRMAPPAVRGLHRGRRQPRHPAQPRLQRRHPGRRRLRPAHHRQGPAGQRGHVPSCIRHASAPMSPCARARMPPA